MTRCISRGRIREGPAAGLGLEQPSGQALRCVCWLVGGLLALGGSIGPAGSRAPAWRLPEADRLSREASVAYKAGDLAEAIDAASRALEIRREISVPADPETLHELNNLGVILLSAGRLEEAAPLLEESARRQEEVRGPRHPLTASALTNLGRLRHLQGDYNGAREILRKAVDIHAQTLGPAHPHSLRSRSHLAAALGELGELDAAQALLEEAVALSHVWGGDPGAAYLLNNLGGVYLAQAQLDRARSAFEQAFDVLRRTWGADHPEALRSRWGFARLDQEAGRLPDARRRFEEILAAAERSGEHGELAVVSPLAALGEVAARLGDRETALRYHERAFGIRLRNLGPQHPKTQISRRHVADRYRELGRDDIARGHYEGILRFQERELGTTHPDTLDTRERLADLLLDAGEVAPARELLEETLQARRETGQVRDPRTAATLARLGFALFQGGDLADAREALERAVSSYAAALGVSHPATLAVTRDLSAVLEAAGNVASAIELLRVVLEGEERVLVTVLSGTAEAEKAAFLDTLRASTHGAVSLHARSAPDDPHALELAFTTVLRRKGRVLDATLEDRRRIERSGDDPGLLVELRRLQEEQAALLLRPPSALTVRQRLARFKELEQAIDRLGREMAGAVHGDGRAVPVTLDAVRARLPPGTVLVEIVRYRPFDARRPTPRVRWGEPRYAAYVLRREGRPGWVELGPAEPIHQALGALREAIARRSPDVVRHGRKLYDLTLGKLEPQLRGASTFLLAPDDALHLAPFAALVDGEGAFLVERFTLRLLTSGRDLVRLAEAPTASEPPLVLGDPDYGPAVPEASPRGAFPRLPGTALEARAAARLLGVPESRLLLGPKATETAVKAARGPLVLHIATHGFFGSARSAPAEVDEEDPWPAEVWRVHAEDPLLRSGLALAGFNRWHEAGGADDGLLTAFEAATLDLSGTEIVVLSACETGVGEARPGQGVFGLRRSLVLAGARTQVMTLWKVADEPTVGLMVAWYERLLQGADRAEAMREVQLAFLRGEAKFPPRIEPRGAAVLEGTAPDPRLAGTRHPYYWAGFIVSGHGGPFLGRQGSP